MLDTVNILLIVNIQNCYNININPHDITDKININENEFPDR